MSFSVYTHDTMPKRWHYSGKSHIAPVYLVPDLGWLLTDHVSRVSISSADGSTSTTRTA